MMMLRCVIGCENPLTLNGTQKTAIEAGTLDGVAALIETVMTAVQAGEIDKVLQGTKCYARQ